MNFRKLLFEDLLFLNETRNTYAEEYLHNSKIFTLEETHKWFIENNPDYYIIEKDNEKIGYFRLSNFSKENNSVYIGADIAPKFRGKGLGKLAYQKFLPFLFKEYNLNKLSLEVLSTNTVAINLYKKIGFVQEGIKREHVIKNNKYIDSCIMSMLYSDFCKAQNLKIELILPYYKRPKIVLNTLESISKSTYTNWHLTFIDDSGNEDFKETFLNYGFNPEQITYISIMMPDWQKVAFSPNDEGGSVFGCYVNRVIDKTDADIIYLICDDDAITYDFLEKLNLFFIQNQEQVWCYSACMFYDPEKEHYTKADQYLNDESERWRVNHGFNRYTQPISPGGILDSCQIAFRKRAFVEKNVWYPFPRTKGLDGYVFIHMYNNWGPCSFTNICGIYKAQFSQTLGARGSAFYYE